MLRSAVGDDPERCAIVMTTNTEPRRVVLRCENDGCVRVWAWIENGMLYVQSKHASERHVNAIPLRELLAIQPVDVEDAIH